MASVYMQRLNYKVDEFKYVYNIAKDFISSFERGLVDNKRITEFYSSIYPGLLSSLDNLIEFYIQGKEKYERQLPMYIRLESVIQNIIVSLLNSISKFQVAKQLLQNSIDNGELPYITAEWLDDDFLDKAVPLKT